MGESGRAAPRSLQPRGGAGYLFHHPLLGIRRPARGPAHHRDAVFRGEGPHCRPCAYRHRCRAVLDGGQPGKAWCEVDNYPAAVSWSAQTALRDAIGSINLADISTRRSQLDAELREVLNAKTSDWGIAILSVEIRNILIPESLQDAMSREAQAQQESNARLILAEIEHQVAELYLEAAKLYRQDDLAFQVRMASMVNESVKEGGNNLIVVPSSFSEGFNAGSMQDLKDMLGK